MSVKALWNTSAALARTNDDDAARRVERLHAMVAAHHTEGRGVLLDSRSWLITARRRPSDEAVVNREVSSGPVQRWSRAYSAMSMVACRSSRVALTLVHPGNTDTDMNPAPDADPAELELIALGHYGQPDDVAATVAHLAGPAGHYITGTAVSVDGGYAA